jgi:hypothetical protein
VSGVLDGPCLAGIGSLINLVGFIAFCRFCGHVDAALLESRGDLDFLRWLALYGVGEAGFLNA